MKKLFLIIAILFSISAIGQVKPSQMSAATVAAYKSKLGYETKEESEAKYNQIGNNVNGWAAVHSVIDSLINGLYIKGDSTFKMVVTKKITPVSSGIKDAVAAYEFDNVSSNTISGLVGTEPDGTKQGDVTITTETSGAFTTNATFAGTSGLINFTNNAMFALTETDFSISLTVNATNAATVRYFLEYGIARWKIYMNETNGLSFNGVGGFAPQVWAGDNFPTGTKALLTVTFNNTSKDMKIYFDGVLKSTTTVTNGIATYSDALVFGASDDDYPDSFFAGKLYQLIIWHKELTAEQISTTIYNGGTGRKYSDF